jgi:DNA-binding NtrC family response regulator
MTYPSILVVDDEESMTDMVAGYLAAKGFVTSVVNDGDDALHLIANGSFSIVISDIYIDSVTGLDVLRAAKDQNPDTAVILMTARGSVKTTVEAEMGGAFDYLAKPFELDDLLDVVERATIAIAGAPPADNDEDLEQFGGIIGFSPAMVKVYKTIAQAARAEETVLITGESGSGKELVARAIHDNGGRSGMPFVPVDSGAVAGSLWESEVFGAVRGAFTGADRDRPGVIATANHGTVFFDEIGEIPVEFQPKLLRLLQEGEYRPVGAGAPRKADVRILAATNRRLEAMVEDGAFREDLYHRLNVLHIEVPPLRARRSDIAFLVKHFLAATVDNSDKHVWLEAGAMTELERHEWPGNVRQLQNLIRRLVATTSSGPVTATAVRSGLRTSSAVDAESEDLSDVERRQIMRVLEQTGGNKTRAAKILGIQRRTLYKKLDRFERERTGHTGVPPETD